MMDGNGGTRRGESEPEETLRRLAGMPAPEGLEDRVHRRLRSVGPGQETGGRLAGLWSLWMPVRRMQFAGAAMLAIAVAGSAWTVYRDGGTRSAWTGPAGTPATVPVEVPAKGFGAAAGRTVPETLTPIPVPDTGSRTISSSATGIEKPVGAKKKKPSAKRMARRPDRAAAVSAKPAD